MRLRRTGGGQSWHLHKSEHGLLRPPGDREGPGERLAGCTHASGGVTCFDRALGSQSVPVVPYGPGKPAQRGSRRGIGPGRWTRGDSSCSSESPPSLGGGLTPKLPLPLLEQWAGTPRSIEQLRELIVLYVDRHPLDPVPGTLADLEAELAA